MATATAKRPGKSPGKAKGAKAPKAPAKPKATKSAPAAQADFLGIEADNVVALGEGVKVREATAADVADFMGSTPAPEEDPAYVAPGLVHHSGDTYTDENGVLVDRLGRELFPPEDEAQDREVVEPAFEPDPELTDEENAWLAAGTHYVDADASVQPKPAAGIGHNNPPTDEEEEREAAAGRLTAFVQRLERLEDEKAAIALDTKEVFAELKGAGFDAKIVRKILALKKRDKDQLAEENAILQAYAQALGLEFLV